LEVFSEIIDDTTIEYTCISTYDSAGLEVQINCNNPSPIDGSIAVVHT
jgi:hypothetical protein